MKHITRVLLAGLSASPWLHAAAQAVPSATAAARPSDVASVDAIIAALYDAKTILADQKRDADGFRSLEMHRDSTDAHPARGINSIQLFTTAPAGGSSACCGTPAPDKPIPTRIPAPPPVIAVATHRRVPMELEHMSTIEAMRSVSTSPGGSSAATDGEPIADHGRALHEVDVELRYQ